MQAIRRILWFLRAEDGPTAVEYAMVTALGVVAAAGAIKGASDALNASLSSSGQQISASSSAAAGGS